MQNEFLARQQLRHRQFTLGACRKVISRTRPASWGRGRVGHTMLWVRGA